MPSRMAKPSKRQRDVVNASVFLGGPIRRGGGSHSSNRHSPRDREVAGRESGRTANWDAAVFAGAYYARHSLPFPVRGSHHHFHASREPLSFPRSAWEYQLRRSLRRLESSFQEPCRLQRRPIDVRFGPHHVQCRNVSLPSVAHGLNFNPVLASLKLATPSQCYFCFINDKLRFSFASSSCPRRYLRTRQIKHAEVLENFRFFKVAVADLRASEVKLF